MVTFVGIVLGKTFSAEASDPLELIKKLATKTCEQPHVDYRMWIKTKSADASDYWTDVCINTLTEEHYNAALQFCDNKKRLEVIIRSKDDSSPNSSPRDETSNDPKTPPLKSLPPTPTSQDDIQDTISTVTASTSEMTLGYFDQIAKLAKIQYWIADMFDFKNAEERLYCPNDEEGVARLLSPYYFTMPEAKYLGNLYTSGKGSTLKELLDSVVHVEDACTSNNLAPKIMAAFKIPKSFHKDAAFAQRRMEWMETQAPIWRGYPKTRVKPNP